MDDYNDADFGKELERAKSDPALEARIGRGGKERLRKTVRILEHYDHAKQKHPYFCDRLIPGAADTAEQLFRLRLNYHHEAQANMLSASTVLDCEIAEVYDAIEKGDKEEAVEECYDAIAVLLRIIDVLSGDQPLGKPAPDAEQKPTSDDEPSWDEIKDRWDEGAIKSHEEAIKRLRKDIEARHRNTRQSKSCAAPETERKITVPLGKLPESDFHPLADLAKTFAKDYHEILKRRHERALGQIREMCKADGEPQNTGDFTYPPIDPDYGTMYCHCPDHVPGCMACEFCIEVHNLTAILQTSAFGDFKVKVQKHRKDEHPKQKGATDAH